MSPDPSTETFVLPKRQSSLLFVAFDGRPSAGSFASRVRRVFELNMRWRVHVLARLAIAAACTNSAAALDARVDRGESPSSTNSLWEHLMSNSPQLANRTAIRDNGQGRELHLEAYEKTGAARENPAQALRLDPREMSSGPSIMPAATPADHENAASSSSMFASFGTAFALHGVSYCNLLHAIATSPASPA